MSDIATTKGWYEASYGKAGFGAQRLYPAEELLRFLGRHYFSKTTPAERAGVRVLEIGCGSCANLWMISREGFDAYGIDLSAQAIELGKMMLERWNAKATLAVGSMTELPYDAGFFDVVCDVYSSNCLAEQDYVRCLSEVHRVLKPGGLFFSYIPSAASDAFKDHAPSKKLDEWTLDGILRPTAPFTGNTYPFRFTTAEHSRELFDEAGLEVSYLETVGRTYRDRQEYFEFLSIVANKK